MWGKKIVGRWKRGRIEKISISLIFVWLGVEKWRDGKSEFIQIYTYTLVKEWCPIKTKKVINKKKKKFNHINLLKNKNYVQKHTHTHTHKNTKESKRKKEK